MLCEFVACVPYTVQYIVHVIVRHMYIHYMYNIYMYM